MNKAIVFIFFILSIITVYFFSYQAVVETDQQTFDNKEQEVIQVLNSDITKLIEKEYEFNDFYLLFDEYKIKLKDITKLFYFFDQNKYEYQIKSIYPYINPMYEDELSNVQEIMFDGKHLNEGINNFYKTYVERLEENNLEEELEKARLGLISIRMIHLNTSNVGLYHFLNKYDDIKYSLSNNTLFRKIN